jgi:nickel transport protein
LIEGEYMLKRIVLITLLLLAATQLAIAHDTYIAKKNGKLFILRGHGEEISPYDSSKVREPKAVDSKGNAVTIEIVKNKENASLSVKGDAAIVGALFDSGYWLKTTDGWKTATKREGKGKYDIVQSYKSTHYCKGFLAPSSQSCKSLGQRFEIVPLKDPTTLSVGDNLSIKVLLDGKPIEGAVITTGGGHASDGKKPLTTNKDGLATVKIEKSSLQRIKAKHRKPFKGDPDADMLSFSGTITFEIQ